MFLVIRCRALITNCIIINIWGCGLVPFQTITVPKRRARSGCVEQTPQLRQLFIFVFLFAALVFVAHSASVSAEGVFEHITRSV